MTTGKLTGGCLCGAVRYEAAALPIHPPTLCHCTSCRRAAGAHAVAWLTVPRAALRWTGAQPPGAYRSSAAVLREFCARCGTPLAYRHDAHPLEVDLTICSLDAASAQGIAPVDHLWMEDALSWDRPADGRPQWQTTRDRGGPPA
jgi:hypothetical protein